MIGAKSSGGVTFGSIFETVGYFSVPLIPSIIIVIVSTKRNMIRKKKKRANH